tara:strand:- start:138 stop:656 length:519 start_codon:yes stop_codon:yes gene_type:complete
MNWVPFGKFGKTHGLKGALKFYSIIDDLEVCRRVSLIKVIQPDGQETQNEVESVRGHRSPFVLKLRGLCSIEQADNLRGCEVLTLREEFGDPPEDKYFPFDVEGLEAYDEGGRYYGTVEEVLKTGSNDVYVIRGGGRELLLPAIDWVICKIDLENKKLIFRVVKGLLEANAL